MAANPVTVHGADGAEVDALIQRLADDDILGQLLARTGKMRVLGTEDGDIKLDWVDGVQKLLDDSSLLDALIAEAREVLESGIRRVIWSAMGGSVQTVYCLKRMGFLDTKSLSIHPLDSSDPAAVNRVLSEVAAAEGIALSAHLGDRVALRAAVAKVLEHTMINAVSMGMTSEEPITHLQWFDGVLNDLAIANPAQHLQVMTIPDSLLDRFARARQARMLPVQPDGASHTPGRMSAPATRVFLRPVSLLLVARERDGGPNARQALGQLLNTIQQRYGVAHGESPAQRHARVLADPFIRLGAFISHQAQTFQRNKLVLILPASWHGLAPWIEQVVEESLGKDGKGWLVFFDQRLSALSHRDDCLFLSIDPSSAGEHSLQQIAQLEAAGQPVLHLKVACSHDPLLPDNLAEVAGVYASWKLAVATFGYLQDIVFVGQPGVEAYKAYARALRDGPGAIAFSDAHSTVSGPVTLDAAAIYEDYPDKQAGLQAWLRKVMAQAPSAADQLAAAILLAREEGWLRYLDITYNGEIDATLQAVFEEVREWIGHRMLGLPVKIRPAPSDYHSTEQSETDGPPELLSIRIVTKRHDEPLIGTYTDRFLHAQARGTWKAMRDVHRWVVLASSPDNREAAADYRQFFTQLGQRLNNGIAR